MITQYIFHIDSARLTDVRQWRMRGAVLTATSYANLYGEHVGMTVVEGDDAAEEMRAWRWGLPVGAAVHIPMPDEIFWTSRP